MAGLEVVSKALKALKRPVSDAEKQLLKKLTAPGSSVEVVVPDDVDTESFHTSLRVVCVALSRATLQTEQLMPVLGRMLDIASTHPELYTSDGYETYEAFIEFVGSEYGVGRSTCFEARRMVQRFPDLTIAQFEKIGRVNMQILAQAIPKGEEDKGKAQKLIAMAQESTSKELRNHCEEKGYMVKGQAEGAYLRVGCNKDDMSFFEEFFNNESHQRYCENANRAVMLRRAIEEATTEWDAQVEGEGE